MIQCFVKKEYEPPFGLTRPPRLFSVSRTDAEASAHPRVMHAHDDLVEIVLVRGGESRYFVGGMPYDARRGDLFIYNSRVVHDEPSGPDRPVASFSLALGGLSVPGLRENALIPDDASPVCPLTEAQTVRLERLYDVLYSELTAGNDDGAHHLLMALLTLVQAFLPHMTDHILRKCAHFGEYALLGVFTAAALRTGTRFSWPAALLPGTFAALCDETIQLFVPGRSGQITDVWLDTAGYLTGALLTLLIFRLCRKRPKQRKTP